MKIKEVETLTGITAKNIRFYEQQGLLSPARNRDNSYRDYDEGDIRTIKLIKMLRKLDMPLENIREVLTGAQPLAGVMQRHADFLEQSLKDLEAAHRVCSELAGTSPEVTTLDVDECLARIDGIEQEGGQFASIVNDFLAVAGAIEKMRFLFYPVELVTTPSEFTDELLRYASENKHDITITKESMYPEFVMDGVEYKAFRYTGRYGSVISVEAKEPEGLMPRHIPKVRRWWMEWVWRTAFPLLLVIAVAGMMVGGGTPLLMAGIGVAIVGTIIVIYNKHG